MTSNIAFTGLASGLNTSALIQNVLRFSQQKITALQNTVTTDTKQQTSFQGLQTNLQTLQTDAHQLGQSQGTVFDAKTATSSNSDVLTAAAGTGAQTGVTSLTVLALAQANQIASQGYSDPNSTISQGTFQISAGSQSASISIDSTNNTLSGLAQAINNAGIGVSATIVNTGSTDSRTHPYRLLLTSNSTGTANAIKITNGLGPDASGAVQPNFSTTDIGPAVTAADFSGTSTITANSGAGNYTGSSNDTYTFSVATGGTVGTDNGIQVNYTNSSGTQTGTLTLNSSDAGTPQAVVNGVTVNFGSGTLNAGDQFSVNVFAPTIQSATNSQVQLGSGAGALIVQNSSNTLTNLIPGVTLSLQSANPTQSIQVNVANDVTSVTTAITNFVADYNNFVNNYTTQTAYTPGVGTASGTAAPLNGNLALEGIANQLQQTLLSAAPGLPSQINSLNALGITLNSNNLLEINSTQLNSALTGGVSGVSFSNIKSLFATQGQSSSSAVQFSTGSSSTNPTTTTPYTVHITQAATQASVTGSSALSTSTVIDGTNNTLSFSLDGKTSGTITLASGTYSQQSLSTEIQTAINASVAANGESVTTTISNNKLQITSGSYGAASQITGLSGSALSALGFSGSETSTGTDVQGSFIANGVTEAATGVGQILTGNSTNANTSGLVVVVSLTPTQLAAGNTDSTLTVTRGLAATLNNTLTSLLDPTNGQLVQINNQISDLITSAQNEVTTQTTALNAQQSALLTQFASLETVLANLQNQSSLLSAFANAGATGSNTSTSTSTASVVPNFSSASTTTTG